MRKSKGQTLKETLDKSGIQKSNIYELHNKYFTTEPPARSIRQKYMGFCSNLIADMVVGGASADEIETAILFSYVVLDSEKYKLSILKAKDDMNIQALHEKYNRRFK